MTQSPITGSRYREVLKTIDKDLLTDGLTALVRAITPRPPTPERALFIYAVNSRALSTEDLYLLAAAAVLADGDAEGALFTYRLVRPLAEHDDSIITFEHHESILEYCRQYNEAYEVIGGYEIVPTKHLTARDATPIPSFLCGLPNGWVLAQSYAPASAEGRVFLNQTVFNPNRAFRYDAYEKLPPLIVGSRSNCLVSTKKTTSYGQAVLIGESSNFGHWLLNHVSRLALISSRKDLRELPLIIGENSPPFVIEMLEFFGYGQERLIRLEPGELAQFELLWVPSMLVCGRQNQSDIYLSAKGIEWLRETFCARFRTPPRRKLFLSRREANRRRLVNEADIFRVLEPLGFELIDPHRISVASQLEMAAESACIVGAFGAAMALTSFAPRQAQIIELVYPGLKMALQGPISRILGHGYEQVIGKTLGAGPDSMTDDFFVEPSLVLSSALKALGMHRT